MEKQDFYKNKLCGDFVFTNGSEKIYTLSRLFTEASVIGNLNILKALIKNGCDWNHHICRVSVAHKHDDIV